MTASDLEWVPLAARRFMATAKEYSETHEGMGLRQTFGLPRAEFIAALAGFKNERAASIQAKLRAAEAELIAAKEKAQSLAVAS
jgi:hypothetical protein